MEKILSKLAAVGIPFGVVQLSCKASGHKGGAALTTGLSSLGKSFGMKGGIVALLTIGASVDFLTERSIGAILNGVVKQLCIEGESQDEIYAKIQKYPVSNELKLKLKETVRQYNALSTE